MNARWLTILAVGLLTVGGVSAQDDPKKDAEKIQGSWTVVTLEQDGEKAPNQVTKNITVEIADGKFIVVEGDKIKRATYKIDPTKNPKTIDLTPLGGVDENKLLPGIYALDGDTLKLCWNEKRRERPKEFVSKPEQTVFVLQRAKPK